MKIKLTAGKVTLPVELAQNETAKAFAKWLPLKAEALRWGEEIYFYTDSKLPAAKGTLEVEIGDVAFWIGGPGIAIFFGETPASRADGKPRPASPVVIIGRVTDDARKLSAVNEGEPVLFERWPAEEKGAA